ncbi:PAAR domain-containing protein [Burkholderia sp. 22PA0106]|uniref:PAAR domain-containing protein n=1 Tax=Burkholderia sp. 22PA0106 TaxID=3237371 RepID=UPI0039C362FE
MRRYDICKGDHTTAGGTVIGGDPDNRILGREQAFELDEIWCPACQRTGRIVATGPRISSTGPDGRESALSDDLCVCDCTPNPVLLASQHVSYVEVEANSHDSQASTPMPLAATPLRDEPNDSRWFFIEDSATAAALPNRDFIATIDGIRTTGKTDNEGYARVMANRDQRVEIHIVFRTPKRTLIPRGR